MARQFSVKAASRRWPVHLFYNVLDLATINATILYTSVTGVKISRKHLIQKLSEELRVHYMREKQQMHIPPAITEDKVSKRKLCQVAK